MNKRTHILQKFALIMAKLCFLTGAVCGILLYLNLDELGARHPVSASFLASVFFFTFVGILLTIVGKSDIPDLRIRPSEKEN